MKKITGSFIGLVLLIIFSSIVYIWQAESEKKALESQIASQASTIEQLEKKVAQSPQDNGDIKGVITNTGEITGTITFVQTNSTSEFIVCARDVRSKQEYCGVPEESVTENEYTYLLDIPVGRYEVFASVLSDTSQNSTKSAELNQTTEVYYSDFTVCNEEGECISDSSKKRFIEIIPNETQTDIDISL